MSDRGKDDNRIVNLALQGGGAHGAFTWGVLDRLLEDERISFEGVSGTSAGAINAALLVDGWMKGGRAGAKEALAAFWRGVSDLGAFSPFQPSPIERWFGGWGYERTSSFLWFDLVNRVLSPYQTNPFNINPLRGLLERSIDFAALRQCREHRLYITTTNVKSGKSHVFSREEASVEALLASACLPHLFQAVEIGDDIYWDGGYLGNPALYPLYTCDSGDIVIVQVNPLAIEITPRSTDEILNRLNEISFNASLMAEIRAIDFVLRQLDQHRLDDRRYKRVLLHMIDAEQRMREFSHASKLTTEWGFLNHLRGIGHHAADRWLAAHYDSIGREPTIDRERFLMADRPPVTRQAPLP